MTKFYKPALSIAVVFLIMLLMQYSRIGGIHPAHMLSLCLLFSAGLAMGALATMLEA